MTDILVRIISNEYVCFDVASNRELCKNGTKDGAIKKLLSMCQPEDIQIFVQDDIYRYLPSQCKKSVPVIVKYLNDILINNSKDTFMFYPDKIASELKLSTPDVSLFFRKHVFDCKLKHDTNMTWFKYSKANDVGYSLLHDK